MPDAIDPRPGRREAVCDLLGMLAYAELAAFSRLAADADLAPDLGARDTFSRLALVEFQHYELLLGRLRELGGDPELVLAPYAVGVATFHARTRPSTWLEAVVKAYVGDGIAADFSREIAEFVDPVSRDVVNAAMADQGRSEVLLALARQGMTVDVAGRGRLALWARRLHGEAITQAQAVAAERDSLTALLTGQLGGPGMDLARLGELFVRLATRHTERMGLLGLAP